MLDIFAKASQYLNQNRPFVLYCKPNSQEIVGFFQKNSTLFKINDFLATGFVFSNFAGTESVLFPEDECAILKVKCNIEAEFSSVENDDSPREGKQAFEQLVQKGIDAIALGSFQKVVLSRKESIQEDHFEILDVFQKMLSAYQNAFRYCWYHPEIGLWMGATPEQLLEVADLNFKTVALAGTQKYKPNFEVIWQEKEKQEQQFVTDFIISELEGEMESIAKTKPYTFKAGTIVHLKTDISGVFKSDYDLGKVINVLHPTPAVCGFPKERAKEFISKNEGYDRKFYAGFLGELNRNFSTDQSGDSDLFVNLRCMEIQQKQVHLYVGCGITKDSNPEKEYFETVSKAMTMKQILN